MSDISPVPRSRKTNPPPQPLLLTPGEADKLSAAVQRLLRSSKAAPAIRQTKSEKSSPR